ncbi:unnamed protein product [Protopolystoma xenopodis]|uniref:Uncharacterized protein n=1 Tax=Protopolystoma xenopodis TaxID=117903 RepID=A0A448XC67_9PLAT|nr:unnamed protein product [Protopolystoma xenopodis]
MALAEVDCSKFLRTLKASPTSASTPISTNSTKSTLTLTHAHWPTDKVSLTLTTPNVLTTPKASPTSVVTPTHPPQSSYPPSHSTHAYTITKINTCTPTPTLTHNQHSHPQAHWPRYQSPIFLVTLREGEPARKD